MSSTLTLSYRPPLRGRTFVAPLVLLMRLYILTTSRTPCDVFLASSNNLDAPPRRFLVSRRPRSMDSLLMMEVARKAWLIFSWMTLPGPCLTSLLFLNTVEFAVGISLATVLTTAAPLVLPGLTRNSRLLRTMARLTLPIVMNLLNLIRNLWTLRQLPYRLFRVLKAVSRSVSLRCLSVTLVPTSVVLLWKCSVLLCTSCTLLCSRLSLVFLAPPLLSTCLLFPRLPFFCLVLRFLCYYG